MSLGSYLNQAIDIAVGAGGGMASSAVIQASRYCVYPGFALDKGPLLIIAFDSTPNRLKQRRLYAICERERYEYCPDRFAIM